MRARSSVRSLWISLLVILLDQATKQIALETLPLYKAVNLFPSFDWYLTYNRGAAFSFLAGAGGWQRWFFIFLSTSISVVLITWIYKLNTHQKLQTTSIALILGGAIGNLIDRSI